MITDFFYKRQIGEIVYIDRFGNECKLIDPMLTYIGTHRNADGYATIIQVNHYDPLTKTDMYSWLKADIAFEVQRQIERGLE